MTLENARRLQRTHKDIQLEAFDRAFTGEVLEVRDFGQYMGEMKIDGQWWPVHFVNEYSGREEE